MNTRLLYIHFSPAGPQPNSNDHGPPPDAANRLHPGHSKGEPSALCSLCGFPSLQSLIFSLGGKCIENIRHSAVSVIASNVYFTHCLYPV